MNSPHHPSSLALKIFTIAENAEKILLKYYKKDFVVEYKKHEFDPVTIADREADVFIREQLHALFPDDSILSEESSEVPENYMGNVWIVDPLDGTKEFVKGSTAFGIHIGRIENGVPTFGCVVFPARNIFLYAEKGKGSFEKKGDEYIPLRVNTVTDLSEVRIVTRNSSTEIRPVEEKIKKIPCKELIPEGCVGAKLLLILRGDAEAHINTNSTCKWDTLAPQVILEEAGGMITNFDGIPLDYTKPSPVWDRSFIVSNNKEVHDKLLPYLE